MAKDNNISITPTTRNFDVDGGGNAIITSGSGTWTAAVSDSWITLNAPSGNVGYPVAYTVSANTNVEQRTGYVYVSGWTHTVTQDGVGGTISPVSRTVEHKNASGTISVTAANGMVWQARPNVNWINVNPTSGIGSGNVTYFVAPYDEVATRQGTITVAGNTFTVFQYGRRMKLDSYSVTKDYETHVIPITVNALAITQWSVTPNNSWISVVDAGNGHGGDLVTIAIAENPSYKARTGTVTIGTETFTVTQQGRPTAALSFSVSPTTTTASVEGANGLIAVTATPDLPWTATSGANWLTVYAATATGAGNGNVVYQVSPNPTLSQRTGMITITPETASGMTAKTHTVTQPAAQSALSLSGYEFEASGESCSVEVSVANIVQWSIAESLDWITVNGSTNRTGPGTVVLQATANNTVYPRSGTVRIAGKNFSVSQKARGVELEYDTKLFGTDGGYESISIHPDGNSSWTAVASDPTWITIFQGDSGTGDGEILYIVSPYQGDGTARTGWITVGDKKVYISQRAYDLNISPNGTNVVGNAGAGEFGVSASINDVWNAIVTEPWITLVSGYDAGTGSGVVRFLYTENNTGKTRTGKIIVAGEVYTLEQRARQMVAITATAEHGGHVSGGGSYDLGSQVTLTAVPDSGYSFSYWTGATNSMQNPLTVTVDVPKSYTAVFAPLPITFTSVVSDTNGVTLTWNNLAWAATYRIYRGTTSVPGSATVLVELPNSGNCTYLDTTGDVDVEYWYWIEAEGPSDEVMSDPMTSRKEKPIVYSPITYTNLRGATNPNPATYREGTLVSFQNPGTVTGYTFAGWTPSQITSDMTGAQTVHAAWTANSYSIAYNANGGSGTMDPTAATYDSQATVATNGFTWTGHVFTGWATNETGEVIYAAGQPVTNLTSQSSGVVTLYAVWEELVVSAPQIFSADGSEFVGDTCEVMILCETEGATIYYSPSGTTPRLTDAFRYSGPFTITDTSTIKAIAVLDGVRSEYVTATITKRSLSLAEAAGATNLTFTTGGDADWIPIADTTAVGGFSVRSGAIGDVAETWMQTSVSGPGTFMFRWKVDCEWDDSGDATWDHVSVTTNGVEAARMDGTSGWADVSFVFDDTGAHTIRWAFVKDDYDEEDADYADCAWVSGVTWTPVVDPLPELPGSATGGQVADALEGSADTNLAVHVTDAAMYNAYRAWADRRGLNHRAAKDAPRAWLSFALDSDKLITKPLERGDVEIEAFSPRSDGLFSFEVSVKDINLGPNALSANLARVFGVEGAASLADGAFSYENVEVSFDAPANGKLRFVARPLVSGGSFFMRVTMVDVYGDVANSDVKPVVESVTVIFDANGGVGGMTTIQECGTAITAPTVTREGYTFTGWSPAVAATVPASNVTYTAQWRINQYTVTFNANGGSGGTTTTQDYGTAITAPTVTREGYTFTGWLPALAATVPATNVTYIAQWEEMNALPEGTTTWYVNGSTGSDSNSGMSESAPKATIQAAIDAAATGDTILVAPGTYAPITSAFKVLSIRSTMGALVTIIDGHVGSGTNRCVHLSDARGSFGPPEESSGAYDSLFEGFTIRNGREENGDGGGIRGGTVRNCIIESCAASGAGGAYGCTLYQCIVRNNIAGDDGGGLHCCIAYDTLIVGNEARNSWGGYAGAAASCSKLYNCTITKNISTGSRVAALDYYISAYNCIVWGNTKTGGESADVLDDFYYCSYTACYTADPGFVDAANGDYRLAEGSPCIDAGTNSYVTTTTDFAGNVRIVNGMVDIGCYEYVPPITWYVNGSAGSDSNSGTSVSSAKATIQAAIDAASSGDMILVAPGTYAPITTENKAITLRGTGGVASTIIDAEGTSQRCITALITGYDGGHDICTNTVVVGFTLQNGDLPLDYEGNVRGGCVVGGTYKNCILLNGTGSGGGNASSAVLENCLVKGGHSYNGGNLEDCIARNCTIVDGYAEDNGGAYYNCAVYNSICYNNDSGVRMGEDGGTSYTTGSYAYGAVAAIFNCEQVNVYKGNPGFSDAANGDYRLAEGSPCIDAGTNSYVTTTTDLAGNVRIVNGTVDIGCYEFVRLVDPDSH